MYVIFLSIYCFYLFLLHLLRINVDTLLDVSNLVMLRFRCMRTKHSLVGCVCWCEICPFRFKLSIWRECSHYPEFMLWFSGCTVKKKICTIFYVGSSCGQTGTWLMLQFVILMSIESKGTDFCLFTTSRQQRIPTVPLLHLRKSPPIFLFELSSWCIRMEGAVSSSRATRYIGVDR